MGIGARIDILWGSIFIFCVRVLALFSPSLLVCRLGSAPGLGLCVVHKCPRICALWWRRVVYDNNFLWNSISVEFIPVGLAFGFAP